jgi:hypothetical protein
MSLVIYEPVNSNAMQEHPKTNVRLIPDPGFHGEFVNQGAVCVVRAVLFPASLL